MSNLKKTNKKQVNKYRIEQNGRMGNEITVNMCVQFNVSSAK